MLSPSMPIRALASGYSSAARAGKWLVMLQAYVDDSISSEGSQRLYLAAYVHTVLAWEMFSDAWAATLKADPPIDYFHMVEAHNRRDAFAGFSAAERTKKVFALARVIQHFEPLPFHASIAIADFDELLKPYVPYPMATPYFPLVYAVMFGIARLHKERGVTLPCDFIFDEHQGLSAKVNTFWDQMGQGLPPETKALIGGSPVFRDDKQVLPLQAADMLVWHVRRNDGDSYPTEYSGLFDQISRGPHYHVELTREILENMASQFKTFPARAPSSRREWSALLREIGGSWPSTLQVPDAVPTSPWRARMLRLIRRILRPSQQQ